MPAFLSFLTPEKPAQPERRTGRMRTAPVTAEVYPGRPQPPRRATHAPSARTRLSNSASDSRTDAATSLRAPGPEDQTALDARAALAQEKCGPTGGPRSARRRDPTRRRALPPRRAAERSRRRRAAPQPRLSADCDLSYLLTGVFSAPASGVFERRADPRHRPADLRLQLLLLPCVLP